MTLEGVISVDGASGFGAGSGGAVLMFTNTLRGYGTIKASGGHGTSSEYYNEFNVCTIHTAPCA